MSYHQGPHDLRLAIALEAETLILGFGDEAWTEVPASRSGSEQ